MHVTLNHRGMFQFNRKAYEELGSPKAAVLLFEKATSTIGISPAHPHLREAFPFRVSATCSTPARSAATSASRSKAPKPLPTPK